MQAHVSDPSVFVRSMANRGHPGGLAATTGRVTKVLDAAGYDPILVETVGVGQSEVEIVRLADTVVVIVTPQWGDGVQADKAGLLEIADIFCINQADRGGAEQTRAVLMEMLDLGPQRTWAAPIVATVAVRGEGVDQLLAAILDHHRHLQETGELIQRRARWGERS
jgi:LAO/AO transport system kinase